MIQEITEDSVQGLKDQLESLMNSLAVLSAEKSRMEASFQSEKRQIRSEREEVLLNQIFLTVQWSLRMKMFFFNSMKELLKI